MVGSLHGRHRRLVPALPRFKVIGKVAHAAIPHLLSQCDVLVLPSYFEGFGAVLLEAMACGLPVIASDASAAPDLITNGHEGFIVPTNNLEALIETMRKCVNSPHLVRKMAVNAKAKAERFTWREYGDQWMTLLKSIKV
jgi:glycosyltransferase involved in cell wall biosynthesis